MQTTGYPCLMYGDCRNKASMLGVYMDEILFQGTPSMVRSSDAIARCFPSKPLQSKPLTFVVSEIERTSSGFKVNQRAYSLSLSALHAIASFDEFRRLRH